MTTLSEKRGHSFYNFAKPLDPETGIMGDGLYSELAKTAAFQRLKSVRFLGGIDYILVPAPNGVKARYTRFQHSLGVARLALLYARERELSYDERRLLYVAAMLHDVGHAPLSHSLEPTFLKYFNIEHHKATGDIITGRTAIGAPVFQVLKWHGINVERVLAIISGDDNSFDGMFSGPINFDTIEGILRSHSYAKNSPTVYGPEAVTRAAIFRDDPRSESIVDAFWLYKDLMYKTVINSEAGVLADFVCQKFMEYNIEKFSSEDYFTTEDTIFKKMVGLREILTSKSFISLAYAHALEPIQFRTRRFFIDHTVPFNFRADVQRYRQSKEPRLLLPRAATEVNNWEAKRDLFYEHGLRTKHGFL